MANNIRLKIGGIEYSISSEDDEAYIRRIAGELERKMNTVQARSPFLSTTMAAVMTALEALDEAKKAEAESENLRLEIKRLLEETACAKMDAEVSRRMLDKYLESQNIIAPVVAPVTPVPADDIFAEDNEQEDTAPVFEEDDEEFFDNQESIPFDENGDLPF
ncbi:MAG: cell division protein ZapA [Clostridia bacterium]|nr:cell division protein ZapA [Clostridia bacterium]